MEKVYKINTLLWPFLSWTITILLFSILTFNTAPLKNPSRLHEIFGILTVSIGLLSPLIFLVGYFLSYFRHGILAEKVLLKSIVNLFLSLVLLTANINFNLMLHLTFPRNNHTSPFYGIHPIWQTKGTIAILDPHFVILAIIDFIHFSITTLSTVEFGDIYPSQWYSKLIVDFEVLVGLSISLIIVGKYFSMKYQNAV